MATQGDQGPRQDGRWSRRKRFTVWSSSGVVGILLILWIIGTAAGAPKKDHSDSAAVAQTISASPSPTTPVPTTTSPSPTPSATTPSPKPATVAPTTKPPAKPHPRETPKGCGTNRDVDVWYKVPTIPDSAQVLGSYNAATCESTFKSLKDTSPTGPGYCTEAGWASDNPGYNAEAEPAMRLKNVQVSIGAGC
jgi:cytoskeletal protein RodZ